MTASQERPELALFADRKPTIVGKSDARELTPRKKHLSRVEVFGDPENEDTSITVVTISGKSYAGKTGFAEKLGKRMRLKKNRIFLVGNFMREAKKAGKGAQGTLPQDSNLDVVSDALQGDIAMAATTHEPAELESRLAGVLVNELRKKNPNQRINSVSILLLADDDIRKERARRRTTDEIKKRIEEITAEIQGYEQEDADKVLIDGAKVRLDDQRQKLGTLDIEDLWEEELRREHDDETQYRGLYPWLSGYERSYMDPDLTDDCGNRVYDIVFDTSNHTPEESYDLICLEIKKLREAREDNHMVIDTLTKVDQEREQRSANDNRGTIRQALQNQPC